MKNDNQSKYKIVSGQLLDKNGNIVPLEFGNPEQIQVLKEYESRISELKDGLKLIVEFETKHTALASFKCVCGQNVFFENEADDDDDVECLNNMKKKCNDCKAEYELSVKDDELFAKKIK
jgi:hypothetical protein